MKKALITVAAMFALLVWPFGGLWEILLKPVIGETPSYAYPMYVGILLLAGIIVGCAEWIVKEIKDKNQ